VQRKNWRADLVRGLSGFPEAAGHAYPASGRSHTPIVTVSYTSATHDFPCGRLTRARACLRRARNDHSHKVRSSDVYDPLCTALAT
jgi:hypothetical protein